MCALSQFNAHTRIRSQLTTFHCERWRGSRASIHLNWMCKLYTKSFSKYSSMKTLLNLFSSDFIRFCVKCRHFYGQFELKHRFSEKCFWNKLIKLSGRHGAGTSKQLWCDRIHKFRFVSIQGYFRSISIEVLSYQF